MNFDFSDDQKRLKDIAFKFLKDRCSTEVVRRTLEGDEPYDRDLWKGIAELEWLATAIPEEYGGIGFGYLELCVVAEELGRALAPVPFGSSIYLAAEALLRFGSEDQKRKYLPKLATGETIGTLAIAEGAGTPSPTSIVTEFRDGKIFGNKLPVPDGESAGLAVVVAKDPDAGGAPGLFVVELDDPAVSRKPVQTIDPSRGHARIGFEGAAAQRLESADGWTSVENLLDRAAVLFAFEQLGGADAALQMAVEYAKTRFAFGRPIGSFQAIKHKLADGFIKNELARNNCYYAAWALSADVSDLSIAAAGARVSATEAYEYIAAESIQTHGGIGFTWESDCHLFYRRSKLLSLSLGSVRRWKDRLITQLEQAG
jgi:acyl-CoA dehydrogenase